MLNKPYDESVEVSDGEEVTSAQASPREQSTQQVNTPEAFCHLALLHLLGVTDIHTYTH